jgi:hypothetical protein
MMLTLRDFATQQLDIVAGEYGPPGDRDEAIERWMRHLVGTGQVPDDILEAMPIQSDAARLSSAVARSIAVCRLIGILVSSL